MAMDRNNLFTAKRLNVGTLGDNLIKKYIQLNLHSFSAIIKALRITTTHISLPRHFSPLKKIKTKNKNQ